MSATSNQAERDVRPAKIQLKISGRLRSEQATRPRRRAQVVKAAAVKLKVEDPSRKRQRQNAGLHERHATVCTPGTADSNSGPVNPGRLPAFARKIGELRSQPAPDIECGARVLRAIRPLSTPVTERSGATTGRRHQRRDPPPVNNPAPAPPSDPVGSAGYGRHGGQAYGGANFISLLLFSLRRSA